MPPLEIAPIDVEGPLVIPNENSDRRMVRKPLEHGHDHEETARDATRDPRMGLDRLEPLDWPEDTIRMFFNCI
jgi:hypothetical protein